MASPFFSIIIPCYNQADYLTDCLNSIQNQTFKNWEAILINDGSTDATELIARTYADADSRILVITQTNQGLSAARNKGISLAKGIYLSFLDSDDFLLSNGLNYVYEASKQSDAELIIGSYTYFKSSSYIHSHFFENKQLEVHDILKSNQAPPVSHFLNSNFAKSVGNFDENLKSCEDWDYWIRVAKMGGRIKTISQLVAAYRYVPDSMSRNPSVMYESLTEVSRRAGKVESRIPFDAPFNGDYPMDYPEIQKNHLIKVLGLLIHLGKIDEAAEWYQKEIVSWKWTVTDSDWKQLSTYLSWRYFTQKSEILILLDRCYPRLIDFFGLLGYPVGVAKRLSRMVFLPQLKKLNHFRFGKYLGALANKFQIY